MATRTNNKNQQADDGWTTVEEELQMKFEQDGDDFTGILTLIDMNGKLEQAHFNGTGPGFFGNHYFINLTRDLSRKLENVSIGSEVRIVRTGTMDTGHASGTPMQVFSVQWRKA